MISIPATTGIMEIERIMERLGNIANPLSRRCGNIRRHWESVKQQNSENSDSKWAE